LRKQALAKKKHKASSRQKRDRHVTNAGAAIRKDGKSAVAADLTQKERARIAPDASKGAAPLSSPFGKGDGAINTEDFVKLLARPPDPSSADVRGQIIRILLDGNLSAAQQRAKIAEAVVLAIALRGQFFFDIEQRDFRSTMFFDVSMKRLELISGDPFHAWLSDWLRINRVDPVFIHIISEIQTVALNPKYSKGIVPEKFWAARPGTIYISNGDAKLVKITAEAVTVCDNGTDNVLFMAGDTLKPWALTEPKNPFQACSVFREASFTSPHGLNSVTAWATSLPSSPRNKPPLCLVGPVGSGKTRLAMSISELYGTPVVANSPDQDGDNDFWVSVDGGGISILDNCDTRVRWLPDAIAAHATGGHRDKRKLYTDVGRVILRSRAWVCITTANPVFANNSGLADRLLVARMDRRGEETTADSSLSDEILAHRNAGLSFIVETLRSALADKNPTPAGLNYRHPDFATFAVRIGRAIGREKEFVAMLRATEQDKSLFCLQNDYIASTLLDLIEREETFDGTASQLREKLEEIDPQFVGKDGKPSARTIGKRLNALWPHLEKILHARTETDRTNVKYYHFKEKRQETPF
jgi:hypothetical protein